MVSTVKSRPNHYDILGLKIGASSDEIARAFMREICVDRPRAFGGVALLSIAYETLRDPIKRRAYDESLGLNAKPQPRVEPKTAAFIAASLRGPPVARPMIARVPTPAAPAPRTVTQPETKEPPRREPVAQATPRPNLSASPARLAQPHPPVAMDEVEHEGIAWRRPAAVAAALVLVVGIAGALAGREAGNDAASAPAVSVKLPAAKPLPAIGGSPMPTPLIERAQHDRPARAAIAAAPSGAAHPPAAPDGLRQVEATLAEASPESASPTEASVDTAVADEPATSAVPASMPLSNALIARTIGRIGYSCGDVASIEGAGAGVFKITCTSGDTYRASPQRGRYRFKRLAGG